MKVALNVTGVFPDETKVLAYKRLDPNGEAAGKSVAEAKVSGTTLTLTGLESSRRYVATATVEKQLRTLWFTTGSAQGEAKTAAGSVTAKTESKTVTEANSNRVSLSIYNTGEKEVWIAKGEKAEVKKGILLPAKTGSVTIEDYDGIVTGITTEGESLLTLSEV